MRNCESCGERTSNSLKSKCIEHTICFYCEGNHHQVNKEKFYQKFKDIIKNCTNCSTFYFPDELQSQSCSYCKMNDNLITGCSLHKICKYCIRYESNYEKLRTCENCLKVYKNCCRICLNYSKFSEPMINPAHPQHLCCKNCFQNHNSEKNNFSCRTCLDFFNRYEYSNKFCILCQKISNINDKTIESCDRHKICFQCVLILNNNTKNVYISKLNCGTCQSFLTSLNVYKYKNSCRSCGNPFPDDLKLKIPTCLSHYFCKICFENMEKNKALLLTCPDCAFYFTKKEVKDSCIICNKFDSNSTKIVCQTHKFCSNCFEIIKNNFSPYKAKIECYDCKKNINILFETSNSKFKRSSSSIMFIEEKKGYLEDKQCNCCELYRKCVQICSEHKSYCIVCLQFKPEIIKRRSNQCRQCLTVLEESCKRCFKPINNPNNRILNLRCDLKHFYCEECFIKPPEVNETSFCIYCKQAYEKKSPNSKFKSLFEDCILCSVSTFNHYSNTCAKHIICNSCLSQLSDFN